jgi:pantoate--beta-alanine ligase
MKEGLKQCNDLVISIFVNPTQFGPGEDFNSYPRDLDRDLALAQKQGVHAVFTPDTEDLYLKGFQSYVHLEHLPNHLCGISRPVHFRGVATIVSKLFNIVKPHIAVFGQKDFQQLAVIKQMTKDLNFDVEIIGVPTLREPDGLAMSSRNKYLSKNQRPAALSLYNCLIKAVERVKNGEKDPAKIIASSSKRISSYSENKIDYIAICDPETLEEIDIIGKPVLMAIAVKVDDTRLIDNMILTP